MSHGHQYRKRIVLMGPPGGGKGTQAGLMEALLKVPHISTGEILRKEIDSGSELGKEIKKRIDGGNFVPDEMIIKILMKRLKEKDAECGYILDGFPRTVEQAEYFDKELKKQGEEIDVVIDLQVPDEYTIERVVGRYSCIKCGATYHDLFKHPKVEGVCDVCGNTEFKRRKDDTYEVVNKRLKIYRKETSPILPYYEYQGILKTVNGTGSIQQVFRKIQRALGVAA